MTYYRFANGEVYNFDHEPHGDDFERLTNKEGKKARREYVAKALRKLLKPNSTVYTKVLHVSRSGMMRNIAVYITINRPKKDGGPYIREITNLVGELLDYRIANDGGLKVSGCGMDMGFAVVYELGSSLWPKGTRKPHGTRNGEPDTSGGYALKQRWM